MLLTKNQSSNQATDQTSKAKIPQVQTNNNPQQQKNKNKKPN